MTAPTFVILVLLGAASLLAVAHECHGYARELVRRLNKEENR